MRASLNPQGVFASDCVMMLYETELSSPATSVTISGLDLDTTNNVTLNFYAVNDANADTSYTVAINNDTTSANYSDAYMAAYGANLTTSGKNSPGSCYLSQAAALAQECWATLTIATKSGTSCRPTTHLSARKIIGSGTAPEIMMRCSEWDNSADNITSLVIVATQANGLGVGTCIRLYGVVAK